MASGASRASARPLVPSGASVTSNPDVRSICVTRERLPVPSLTLSTVGRAGFWLTIFNSPPFRSRRAPGLDGTCHGARGDAFGRLLERSRTERLGGDGQRAIVRDQRRKRSERRDHELGV